MRFLITNDDGFDAPGLVALYRILRSFGHVDVVAPAVCHSCKGHAVEMGAAIRVEERSLEDIDRLHVVNSTPADCVRLGLKALLPEPPDVVIAGINPGANLGIDVFYSGTVAAAREAAILGIRSLAVSQYTRPDALIDWNSTGQRVAAAIEQLLDLPTNVGEFWNVNLPALSPEEQPKPLVFVPLSTESHCVEFESGICDETGHRLFRYVGDYRKRGIEQTADVQHVFDGHVTATRMHLGRTAVD